MQSLSFTNQSSQRIYADYMQRCKRMVHILSAEDQNDSIMEINSYIHEYMQNNKQADELTALLNILERLGMPEVTLKEVVASKKINQAVKTYNLKYLIQALYLNLYKGAVYIVLFILTLLVVTFPVLIVFKIFLPEKVGLWIGGGNFIFGFTSADSGAHEVLGHWFIPVVILITLSLYYLIIFFLKKLNINKS